MTGRAIRESHSHQTKACAPLLLSFALSRAEGIVGIHVRHGGANLSQANDKGLDLLRRKSRQQSFFARKRRNNNAVVKRVAGFGQSHDSRTIVLGVRFARHKPLLLEHMQTPADRAFVEADRVDDLVGADIGHSREYAHHAPFGDAETEVLPVGIGCTARQSVRNISEKIRNVPIEIEHGATGYGCGPLTSVLLLHENCPATSRRKFGRLHKTEHTK